MPVDVGAEPVTPASVHPAVIVIPTWDGWDDLQKCLRSLPGSRLVDVVVVDNGSVDGTCEHLHRHFPQVTVISLQANIGFAPAVNLGIVAAAGRDVILLNNDVVAEADWLVELEKAAAQAPKQVGFVTSKILRSDGSLLDSAGDVQTWSGLPVQRGHGQPDDGRYDDSGFLFSACGGASWFRAAMLADVGLLEESFFAYYEDVDLCSRAQLRGWTGVLAPAARVLHSVSSTTSRTHGFKRYLSTRNSYWLVARTIPGPLLPRVMVGFVAYHLVWLAQAALHGELRSALRGHAHGLRGVPTALAARRDIHRSASVSARQFAALLESAHLTTAVVKAFRDKCVGPKDVLLSPPSGEG